MPLLCFKMSIHSYETNELEKWTDAIQGGAEQSKAKQQKPSTGHRANGKK